MSTKRRKQISPETPSSAWDNNREETASIYDDSKLKCNICWNILPPDRAYLTICSHVFCPNDGKAMEETRKCLACGHSLEQLGDIAKVDMTESKDRQSMMTLFGWQPEKILNAAKGAISFWLYQQQNIREHERILAQTKYEELLQEIKLGHSKQQKSLIRMKQDLDEAMEQLHHSDLEKKDLESRLEMVHSQKRDLMEMYQGLKGEYNELHRIKLGSNEMQHIDALVKTPNNAKRLSGNVSRIALSGHGDQAMRSPLFTDEETEAQSRYFI